MVRGWPEMGEASVWGNCSVDRKNLAFDWEISTGIGEEEGAMLEVKCGGEASASIP